MRIFCLPFAGGSKYSYSIFSSKSDTHTSFLGLDLPGRGSRVREPLLDNIYDMADDIFNQLKGRTSEPYSIFGHSMGAILGLLTARKILHEGLRPAAHLFFSGCPAPSIYKSSNLHKLPRDAFMKRLKELDGTPKEMFQSEDLLSFFEPILRSDFKSLSFFRYKAERKLISPISVFIGDDEGISTSDADQWKAETEMHVQITSFPGKHFFIFENIDDIIRVIHHSIAQPRDRNLDLDSR